MTSIALPDLVKPLLAWYDRHARILPWRENPTPYRVWISEIMLQQTRVETVKPYYERFLAELPDAASLAAAPEERLLKLWEGLGYYSRVRNLRKAAQMMMEKYGGDFPPTQEELGKLPGIGDYTAGAIGSIAFGRPTPAVDGNVLRVLSRVTADRADIADPATKKRAAEALRAIFPARRCGDFTQSLMELGATVCLPNGEPQCLLCPLAALCEARQLGIAAELPIKAPKKARKVEERTVFVLRSGDLLALRRRPAKGLLAGMLELPNVPGQLSEEQAHQQLAEWQQPLTALTPTPGANHQFTHIEWRMTGYQADCPTPSPSFEWHTLAELREKLSLPSAFAGFRQLFS